MASTVVFGRVSSRVSAAARRGPGQRDGLRGDQPDESRLLRWFD